MMKKISERQGTLLILILLAVVFLISGELGYLDEQGNPGKHRTLDRSMGKLNPFEKE